MFEFNPELIAGDDDEADEVTYQRETHDDDDVCPSLNNIFIVIDNCNNNL